jgi:WD40 repeat protein
MVAVLPTELRRYQLAAVWVTLTAVVAVVLALVTLVRLDVADQLSSVGGFLLAWLVTSAGTYKNVAPHYLEWAERRRRQIAGVGPPPSPRPRADRRSVMASIAVAAACLVIAVTASLYGVTQVRQSARLRQVAGADALSLDASLRLNSDPALAQSVAADALALHEDSRTTAVTMAALSVPLHGVSTTAANDPVTVLVSSPDARVVASGDAGGGLQIRDTGTGLGEGAPQQQAPIAARQNAHAGRVTALAFSRGGSWLVSAGADRVLRLWDARSLTPIGETSGQGLDEITSLAAVDDDATMVSGGVDAKLTMWRLSSRGLSRLGALPTQAEGITALAASPDGHRLVSGAANGMLRLWDAGNWRNGDRALVGEFTHPRYYAAVSAIAFAPAGDTFAAATTANNLDLWSAGGLSHRSTLAGQHTGAVTALAFAAGGKLLATGAKDRSVVLWHLNHTPVTAEHLVGPTGPVDAVTFARRGQQVWASSGVERALTSWATSSEQVLGQPLLGHRAPVNAVLISSDGRTLISGDEAGVVLFWDRQGRRRIGDPITDNLKSSVTALALDPQSQVLVVAHENGVLEVLDARTHRLRQRMITHGTVSTKVWSVSLSPDGQTLATAGDDHLIRFWNLPSGRQITTLSAHRAPVQDIAFSPDGTFLASSGDDGTVQLWDVRSRQPLGPLLLDKPGVSIWGVAFSPDGSRLAASGQDRTVRVWNLRSRSLLATLDNGAAPVDDVAFMDNDHVITTNGDGLIRLWDLTTHTIVGAPIHGHIGWVDGLAVDTVTGAVFTGGDDATVRMWDLNRKAWLRRLCDRASRPLTKQEWRILLPDNDYQPQCRQSTSKIQ